MTGAFKLMPNPACDVRFVFFCLAGGVSTKLRATDGKSMPLLVVLTNSKIKSKPEPGGCAPRLRLTLFLAQKSKQKRACGYGL